jgi:hypothetical protein
MTTTVQYLQPSGYAAGPTAYIGTTGQKAGRGGATLIASQVS